MTDSSRGKAAIARRTTTLWGPAFVVAIAYIDPGNVATNFAAGAQQGYRLLWVVLAANLIGMLVQYLAAKLFVATGRTLPEMLAAHTGRAARLILWAQAETVAAATDMAEVVGGAVALRLLFGLPLLTGALVTGAVSWLVLAVQERWNAGAFQAVVAGLGGVALLGFSVTLVAGRPRVSQVASGLIPHLPQSDGLVLAVGIIGATVMPHAIYMHGSLVHDRACKEMRGSSPPRPTQAVRSDVVTAMSLASIVNMAMLITAAAALEPTRSGSFAAIHQGLSARIGTVATGVFAVALLASGLASTAAGTYAGGAIMEGFLGRRVPSAMRRLVTLAPSVAVLAIGVEPGKMLVLSQVVLSFGIPVALWPLVLFTARRSLLHEHGNHPLTTVAAAGAAALITTLNLALLASALT